uniref:Uncharacterized protein n=1 Tax=Avena sativa TaxID=4498 RepID=A0ACD5XFW5_AVESA
MNCGPPDQLPPSPPASFLNLNWDSSMDASAAGRLDPMASSPAASNSTAPPHGISPRPHYGSSPPKLNLSMMGQQYHHHHHHYPGGACAPGLPTLENLMPMGSLDQFLADPGFAERAARLSGFDARGSYGGQFGLPDDGPVGALREMELGNGRDESSVSDPASAGAGTALKGASDGNARKRKAAGGKGKGKDSSMSTSAKDLLAKDDSASKRCKSMESNGGEDSSAKGKAAQSSSENGGKKQGKDGTSKPVPDPHQDFIHVRARRGEATDSHSLAERVRREKISQRMKLLQDLVPGCNKVVGKAVMLDEIINYVQSLQRQVEFLSMKLATVNPQLDFNNLPSLLAKDMQQSCGPLQGSHFPLDASGAPLPYMSQGNQGSNPLGCGMGEDMDDQGSMHPLDPAFCRSMGSQHHFLNGVGDAASQVGAFWQDLQSVVQMDMGQSQEIATSSNSYDGSLQTVHMKMEL